MWVFFFKFLKRLSKERRDLCDLMCGVGSSQCLFHHHLTSSVHSRAFLLFWYPEIHVGRQVYTGLHHWSPSFCLLSLVLAKCRYFSKVYAHAKIITSPNILSSLLFSLFMLGASWPISISSAFNDTMWNYLL